MSAINYSTSNILEFESVMDVDLAIVQFMVNKYAKSKYIRPNVIKASSENVLKNLLLYRENVNPLTIVLKEDYIDSADDMLKDLNKTYEKEILELAKPNDVFRYVKNMEETDGIIINTINCRNTQQKQLINTIDKDIRTCVDKFDISDYSCLFIKDICTIPFYRNLGGKYIFILNCKYNLDENYVPKVGIMLAGGWNKIRTIDPYIGLIIPKGK